MGETTYDAELGRAVHAFQRIEAELTGFASLLIEPNEPIVGFLATSRMTFRNIPSLVYSTWRVRYPAAEDAKLAELKSISHACEQLADRRNALVHSNWLLPVSDAYAATTLRLHRASDTGLKAEDVTIRELQAFTADAKSIVERVLRFIEAHAREHPAVRMVHGA